MTNIEPLMTQAQVAELLSKLANISARHIYDRWVHLPDFPKPVLLPIAVGSKRPKRWHRADIVSWAERNKLAA